MVINKAIVGASYDDSGGISEVIKKIESQAIKEKQKSGRSQHNLYRSIDDVNSSKFNYSIRGVPIIAYVMMNFYHSGIERLAIVGDDTTRKIFDSFTKYFNVNAQEKRFVFIPEGDKWSLENTMRKGKQGIDITDDEMIIFCSGDLPLGSNIEQFRTDSDLNNYDFMVNLNSMENIYGKDFNNKERVNGSMIGPYRRWHLPLKDKKDENNVHWIKENNLWMLKLDESFLHKVNIAYSGRKQYDDNPGSNKQKGGRWNTIKELTLKDGKWYKLIKEIPEVFPYLLVRGISSYNPPLISFETLSNFASIGLEKEVKVKSTHTDFGFLDDIDSVEDIIFNEMMMHSIDPNSLHPQWDQLKDFRTYLWGEDIPIVNQFHKYMNNWFGNFSNLRGNEMFNLSGVFQETELTKSMEDNVDIVVNNRQKYIHNLSLKPPNSHQVHNPFICQH